MYLKAIKNKLVKYPYTWNDLRDENPNVGFPSDIDDQVLKSFNMYRVVLTVPPLYDAYKEIAKEGVPVYASSTWTQTWDIVPATPEEASENMSKLEAEYTALVQARLDNFAKTRGYNSINDACTYALSANAQFKLEGEYCINARDETWSFFAGIITSAKNGVGPFHSNFAKYEIMLPRLEWPSGDQ